MMDHVYRHEPKHTAEMFVPTLRYPARPLILSGLVYGRVNPRIGDEFLMILVIGNVPKFGQKSRARAVADPLYRCDNFQILDQEGVAVVREHVCQFHLPVFKMKQRRYLASEDYLFRRAD